MYGSLSGIHSQFDITAKVDLRVLITKLVLLFYCGETEFRAFAIDTQIVYFVSETSVDLSQADENSREGGASLV
jgi:hypothetical protein